jgi:hypothetical protein
MPAPIGFEQLGNQSLKGMALQRGADAQHVGERRGVPGRAQRDLACADVALSGAHAGDPVPVGDEPGDLAILDDVDPGLIGATGESPCDVVVLGDARPWLIGRAKNRIANVVGDVDDRAELLDFVRIDPLGVDAVELVGLDAPHALTDVLQAVGEVEHTALLEQDRVVEVVLEAFPQLERMLVDARALVPQVVGPDQGGVAGHVAAGEPTAFQHRDVGDAMVPGQVVRRGQPVPPATDDEDVVGLLRLRDAPEEFGVIRQVRAGGNGRCRHRAACARAARAARALSIVTRAFLEFQCSRTDISIID